MKLSEYMAVAHRSCLLISVRNRSKSGQQMRKLLPSGDTQRMSLN